MFSLLFGEGVSNIKLKSIAHVSIEKLFNSFIDTFWTVHLVFAGWVVIADETVLTNFVIEENK